RRGAGRPLGRQLPWSVGIISERIAMASKQEVFLTGDAELSTGVQYGASISLGDTSEIERNYGPAEDRAPSCATALSRSLPARMLEKLNMAAWSRRRDAVRGARRGYAVLRARK